MLLDISFWPEGQPEGENENQPLLDGNQAVENNEHVVEPGADNAGNRWWGIVKEIQMIVFGFITSLLPGFHNLEHGWTNKTQQTVETEVFFLNK